jgi:hypothetical protein
MDMVKPGETKTRVMCPECYGDGYRMELVGDNLSEVPCEFCEGKKVLMRVTTVRYEPVKEEKQ